jgi:hypothetical protein
VKVKRKPVRSKKKTEIVLINDRASVVTDAISSVSLVPSELRPKANYSVIHHKSKLYVAMQEFQFSGRAEVTLAAESNFFIYRTSGFLVSDN